MSPSFCNLRRALLLALALACSAAGQSSPQVHVAAGWTLLDATAYRAGIDPKVSHSGRASLSIASTRDNAEAAAVRQLIRADAYRGKRIRLSGWLKAAGAGAALWLRIDMDNGDYILDGMLAQNPARAAAPGADGWAKYDIVAAVPTEAIGISFGARMEGAGEIWADDLSITEVKANIPTTTIERRHLPAAGKAEAIAKLRREYQNAPARPLNLGFEQR